MNSDKISTTGARDSEKKTMVQSIVYTVYVTEKKRKSSKYRLSYNLILQLFQFINLFAAVKCFLENSNRNHL